MRTMWLCLATAPAFAAPFQMNFQTRLLDVDGNAVETPLLVTVALFGSKDGADERWADDFPVSPQGGYFSVMLGSGVALDHDLFSTGELWVEVRDGSTVLSGRSLLAYAPRAAVADAVRVVTAPPSGSCTGQIGSLLYDSDDGDLLLCDGASWVSVGSTRLSIEVDANGAYRYSDGSVAATCDAYRHPTGTLPTATQDGVYVIRPASVDMTVYCDMTIDGGGWTLISNRRAGASNIESFGGNLQGFFGTGGGSATAIGASESYAMSRAHRNSLGASEMLVTQFSGGVLDADDAYIVDFGTADLFPDNTAANNVAVTSVCTLDRVTCDTTNVIWKYLGTGHYSSSLCQSGQDGGGYGGNYGICHNGAGNYSSSSFTGNREQYLETKLWNYADASGWQERLWFR